MDSSDVQADLKHVLYTKEQIQQRITELAAQIDKDYEGRDLLIVGVLKGAVMVMADLARGHEQSHVSLVGWLLSRRSWSTTEQRFTSGSLDSIIFSTAPAAVQFKAAYCAWMAGVTQEELFGSVGVGEGAVPAPAVVTPLDGVLAVVVGVGVVALRRPSGMADFAVEVVAPGYAVAFGTPQVAVGAPVAEPVAMLVFGGGRRGRVAQHATEPGQRQNQMRRGSSNARWPVSARRASAARLIAGEMQRQGGKDVRRPSNAPAASSPRRGAGEGREGRDSSHASAACACWAGGWTGARRTWRCWRACWCRRVRTSWKPRPSRCWAPARTGRAGLTAGAAGGSARVRAHLELRRLNATIGCGRC